MDTYERSPRLTESPYQPTRKIESPQRSPRRSPPPSPSRSLFGVEKIVTPYPLFEELSYRSWDTTPHGSSTDVYKPLPQSPRGSRTSSMHSGGSGYTRIIESYGDEEIPPMLALLQPSAYHDAVPAALQNYREVPWYADLPKTEGRELRATQSIPKFQYAPFRDERWNVSAHELSQAPAFSEFRNRMHDPVSPIPPGSWPRPVFQECISPPLVYPDYHLSHEHKRHYLPGPTFACVARTLDPGLVPQPLRMSKTASIFFDGRDPYREWSGSSSVKNVELLDIKEAQRRAAAAKQAHLEARAAEFLERRSHQLESNLIDLKEAQHRAALNSLRSSDPYEEQSSPRSQSVSSDSFVIYTGLRESVKAMIKQKMKQRKELREIEKAAKVQDYERRRVMEIAEDKYPAMKNSRRKFQDQRKQSWIGSSGNRSSLSDSVTNVLRNLSISKTQRAEQANRGRTVERGRRPKQLAVPPSPYQKHGVEVWFAKNKKKDLAAEGGMQRAPATKKTTAAKRFVQKRDIARKANGLKKKQSDDVKEAYQQGAKELREMLHVGGKNKTRRKFGRTTSEVKRERLKNSISVLGPARRPVATQIDDQWV